MHEEGPIDTRTLKLLLHVNRSNRRRIDGLKLDYTYLPSVAQGALLKLNLQTLFMDLATEIFQAFKPQKKIAVADKSA